MEDAFRFAVLALFEANEAMCAADPRLGRNAQHTILDVPALLERRPFAARCSSGRATRSFATGSMGYFDDLDPQTAAGDHQPGPDQGPQVPRQPGGAPDRRPTPVDDRLPPTRSRNTSWC